MKRMMWLLLAMGLTALGARAGRAQETVCPLHGTGTESAHTDRCLYFTMERFGVMVPAYTVAVREDGKLKYWENADAGSALAQRNPWLPLSAGTTQLLLAAEANVRSGACMAHVRNLGFGGKATMIAWSSAGRATCSFVSSSDPAVSSAATTFQAIAEMLQGGERLDRDHHGDRLGMERDLDELIEKAKAGKAIEPQLIAVALESIANDDAVVDIVRQKALGLLHPAAASASSAR
jgi:hypothetical protein